MKKQLLNKRDQVYCCTVYDKGTPVSMSTYEDFWEAEAGCLREFRFVNPIIEDGDTFTLDIGKCDNSGVNGTVTQRGMEKKDCRP